MLSFQLLSEQIAEEFDALHDAVFLHGGEIEAQVVAMAAVGIKRRAGNIGDLARLNDPRKSTQVALGVDIPRFMQNLMSRVGRALGGGR